MALTADGKVFSWGDGELGQLGHGDNQYVCGSPGISLCVNILLLDNGFVADKVLLF